MAIYEFTKLATVCYPLRHEDLDTSWSTIRTFAEAQDVPEDAVVSYREGTIVWSWPLDNKFLAKTERVDQLRLEIAAKEYEKTPEIEG